MAGGGGGSSGHGAVKREGEAGGVMMRKGEEARTSEAAFGRLLAARRLPVMSEEDEK